MSLWTLVSPNGAFWNTRSCGEARRPARCRQGGGRRRGAPGRKGPRGGVCPGAAGGSPGTSASRVRRWPSAAGSRPAPAGSPGWSWRCARRRPLSSPGPCCSPWRGADGRSPFPGPRSGHAGLWTNLSLCPRQGAETRPPGGPGWRPAQGAGPGAPWLPSGLGSLTDAWVPRPPPQLPALEHVLDREGVGGWSKEPPVATRRGARGRGGGLTRRPRGQDWTPGRP